MREIVKPAAGFLRGISTGNVKLEDEGTKKTHETEKKEHPPLSKREILPSRRPPDVGRVIPVCEFAERKLTMRRVLIATFIVIIM